MPAAAAVALVLALLSASAGAAPEVSVKKEHYVVAGSNPAEIRSELNHRRPKGWDGYTSWYVSWRFRHAPDGGTCRMTSVTTTVTVTHTLPQWKASAQASSGTREAWDRYLRALTVHEDGHRDIGIAVANQIDAALRGMREASCPELTRRANETGHRLLDEARAREREYDRTTDHGAAQGARFP